MAGWKRSTRAASAMLTQQEVAQAGVQLRLWQEEYAPEPVQAELLSLEPEQLTVLVDQMVVMDRGRPLRIAASQGGWELQIAGSCCMTRPDTQGRGWLLCCHLLPPWWPSLAQACAEEQPSSKTWPLPPAQLEAQVTCEGRLAQTQSVELLSVDRKGVIFAQSGPWCVGQRMAVELDWKGRQCRVLGQINWILSLPPNQMILLGVEFFSGQELSWLPSFRQKQPSRSCTPNSSLGRRHALYRWGSWLGLALLIGGLWYLLGR